MNTPPLAGEDLNETMDEGMPPEPAEAGPAASAAPGTIAVPLDALSMPDDEDQMQAPKEGDKGQFNGEFEVVGVDGNGQAFIKITAVNGHELEEEGPADGQEAGEGGASDSDQLAELQDMARQQG